MHSKLNTDIWVNNRLRREVREALLKLSHRILRDSKIPKDKITDIIFTGSLAGYNYTSHSDLDLHFIVKFDELDIGQTYVEEFLNQIKTIWNDKHNVDVLSYDVEVYFQDVDAELVASAVYSLLDDAWIKSPSPYKIVERPSKYKYYKIKKIIEDLLKLEPSRDNMAYIERVQEKIARYRLCGLESSGEMGTENLTYKKLRANGYITKMHEIGDKLYDKYYSVGKTRHKI